MAWIHGSGGRWVLEPGVRRAAGGNTRNDPGRIGQRRVLVCDRCEPRPDGINELPGLQKEIRVGRAAVTGIPSREGFVEEDAARGDGCDNL